MGGQAVQPYESDNSAIEMPLYGIGQGQYRRAARVSIWLELMNAEWWRGIAIFLLGIFVGFSISWEVRNRTETEEEDVDDESRD